MTLTAIDLGFGENYLFSEEKYGETCKFTEELVFMYGEAYIRGKKVVTLGQQ